MTRITLNLQAIDREGRHADVPRPEGFERGVVLYWLDTTAMKPKTRRRRKQPEIAADAPRVWQCQTLIFRALRPDHEDRVPETVELMRRVILNAYVLAACHNDIASDAEIVYEVLS